MLPTRRVALSITLAGAALAACAPAASGPERTQAFKGPVEVTFWDWFPDRTAYWEDQFRAIGQEHPQVKYSLALTGSTADQLTKVNAALAGGSAPEAMFLHNSMFLDLSVMGGRPPLRSQAPDPGPDPLQALRD